MDGLFRVGVAAVLVAMACGRAAGDAPRIVSCAPAATETIFDLGGEGCLVGRSSACLYPAAATNLPSVGAYSAPSIERIVALAPTHVLMTYLSDPSMSNRLERLGVRVLQFPCERLADYAPMRARLAALCGLVPRRMLAVVQREPLIVAGLETLPDDVLAEVGCANAVTNRKGYFVLSPEERVKLAPEGEVDFSMDYDLTRLGPKLPAAIDELRRKLAATATGGTSVVPVADALFWLRLWRVLAGLIVGAASGAAMFLLLTIAGLSSDGASLSSLSAVRLAALLTGGMLGGILGVRERRHIHI